MRSSAMKDLLRLESGMPAQDHPPAAIVSND
jgi:hypothetical protein